MKLDQKKKETNTKPEVVKNELEAPVSPDLKRQLLTEQVKELLARVMEWTLFEINDALTRQMIRMWLERKLVELDASVDFVVTCDDSNNPRDIIELHEFIADVSFSYDTHVVQLQCKAGISSAPYIGELDQDKSTGGFKGSYAPVTVEFIDSGIPTIDVEMNAIYDEIQYKQWRDE
jgi:hypothetical protein